MSDRIPPRFLGLLLGGIMTCVLFAPILRHEFDPMIKPNIYDEMRDGLSEEATILGTLNFNEESLQDDPYNTTMRMVEYGGV